MLRSDGKYHVRVRKNKQSTVLGPFIIKGEEEPSRRLEEEDERTKEPEAQTNRRLYYLLNHHLYKNNAEENCGIELLNIVGCQTSRR